MLKRNIFLLASACAVAILTSCEDIDIKRKILVVTDQLRDYGNTWAEGKGEIIDMGHGQLLDHGFIVSNDATNPNFMLDRKKSLGSVATIGEFTGTVSNLTPGTQYFLFSYAMNEEEGVVYGEPIPFTTYWDGGHDEEWIYYDSGINDGGIGLTDGGSFHAAIRFYPADLLDFAGGQLTSIRLWVRSLECFYSVKIWLGTALVVNQPIAPAEIELDNWSEITLQQAVNITGNQTLIIGYAVHNHPAGVYPAGHDEGPASAGKGDLYSEDYGATWLSLYAINPDLNYNWNLRGFVVYPSGKSKELKAASEKSSNPAEALKTTNQTPDLVSSTQFKHTHDK